jgi:hypothetical protein
MVIAVAGAAYATPVPVDVTFDGLAPSNPGVQDPFHNYVTPYLVTIDGPTGQKVQVVTCYDIEDEITPTDPPPPLSYQELSIDDVLADGMFKGTGGVFEGTDALTGYESIAWLSTQTYSTTAQEIGLQYAIWDVFGQRPDEGCTDSHCVNVSALGSSSDPSSARSAYDYYEGLLTTQIGSGFAGFDFSNAVFLEPTAGAVGGTTQPFVFVITGGGGDQSSTPEPGTIVMIGSGLLCLLSSLGFKRFGHNRG